MKKGFTLIELIIVIVILAIIGSIAGSMMYEAFRAANVQYNLGSLDGQARLALERMTREIRTMRSHSASDFSTLGASQIIFKDLEGNTISYSVSGTNLMQNSQVLANNVSSLAFQYFNSAGTVTAVSTDVQYITITLDMSKGNNSVSLETTISPRNFHD